MTSESIRRSQKLNAPAITVSQPNMTLCQLLKMPASPERTARRRGAQVNGEVSAAEKRPALQLPWGVSEIIPLLYIGDLQDAVEFDGIIINLLNDVPAGEPRRSIHLPFLGNGRASLDTVAALVDAALARGQRVLVHCEEGSERAPLVVAWFLMRRRSMTIAQAYELIKAKRPITRDRRKWLGIYNR